MVHLLRNDAAQGSWPRNLNLILLSTTRHKKRLPKLALPVDLPQMQRHTFDHGGPLRASDHLARLYKTIAELDQSHYQC